MCDYFEVRHHCPSNSFLFACIGAFLGSTNGRPEVGSFALRDSALGLVLVDLSHLLCQSLN